MNDYRNKASFGKRQEYIAIAKLLERNFDVYVPIVDDKGIDCIIRRGDNDYIEIQIKARSQNCAKRDAGRFAGLKIPEPRKNYFFLFYSAQADTYWIFPSLALVDKKEALTSEITKGESAGKYNINLTGVKKGEVYPLQKYYKYEKKLDTDLTLFSVFEPCDRTPRN